MIPGLDKARALGLPIHEHRFGRRSESQLLGVLPAIVDVARLAICLNEQDGTIVPPGGGLRTYDQALQNVKNGTGILNSRHRRQADGWGHAIDLAPYPIDWSDIEAFKRMADSVQLAAAILQVPIRQGRDWDNDGKPYERGEFDIAHFEDPDPWRMQAAIDAMHRFTLERGLVL